MPTPGKDTSEFNLAGKQATWVVVVTMVIGLILQIGPGLLENPVFAQNAHVAMIIGVVLQVAGVVHKLLATLGYTQSRTALKSE